MSSSTGDPAAETIKPAETLIPAPETADYPETGVESAAYLTEPETNGHREDGEIAVADITGEQAAAAPAAFHLTRGRYRSAGLRVLELRVDVDGPGTLRKVSGDFFTSSGSTTSYTGSFIVDAPAVTVSPHRVVIRGQGRFSGPAPFPFPFVEVTIPRRPVAQPRAAAVVRFIRPPNQVGVTYVCSFRSAYFRTVRWEQDSVTGKVPFVSYDTGSLPQPPGSPARVLTVPRAFAEAGIDLVAGGAANVLGDSQNGWTIAELHAAMQTNFSLWRNVPQWMVWLLVASRFEGNAGVRGIMFDAQDAFQRQGCAVFYDLIQGMDPESQRAQLRTYVHELGHAFNLLHSWQKDLATPPAPLGPNRGFGDLSWMNYPQNYDPDPDPPNPEGAAAYWRAFPFSFTAAELVHLRHGFHRDVIMGANPFGRGAADIDADLFDEPVVDESGLVLDLRATKQTYAYGEPVVVELRLGTTDLRGRSVHEYLHPDYELVSVAIRQPSGRTVLYRPLMRRCVDAEATTRLHPERNPAVYASAYVGYGQDGHYFQQPGTYQLRAAYVAADGSRIVSPVLRTVVRYPRSESDEQVAELMLGEEQGTLFALRGSDSPSLRSGNDALQEVVKQHGKHPLAVYARMVQGLNAEHEFKYLTADKNALKVRSPEPKEAIGRLTAVVKATTEGSGVDGITLNMVMRRLARAHARDGDRKQSDGVLNSLVERFDSGVYRPHVIETVRRQAEETRRSIHEEFGG